MSAPRPEPTSPVWLPFAFVVPFALMAVMVATDVRFQTYDEGRAWLIIQDVAAWWRGGGERVPPPELFHHGAPLFYLIWAPLAGIEPHVLASLCHFLSLVGIGWGLIALLELMQVRQKVDKGAKLIAFLSAFSFPFLVVSEVQEALARFTVEGLGYLPLAVCVHLWMRGRYGWAGVAAGCALTIHYKLLLWTGPAAAGLWAAGRLSGPGLGYGWRAWGRFIAGAAMVAILLMGVGVGMGLPGYQYPATWAALALRNANPEAGSNAGDFTFYLGLTDLSRSRWPLGYMLGVSMLVIAWVGHRRVAPWLTPSLRGWAVALLVWIIMLLVLPKAPRMLIPLVISLSAIFVEALSRLSWKVIFPIGLGIPLCVMIPFWLNVNGGFPLRSVQFLPDDALDTLLARGATGRPVSLYRMPQVYPLAKSRNPKAYEAWVAHDPPHANVSCPPTAGEHVGQAYLLHPYQASTGCPVDPLLEGYWDKYRRNGQQPYIDTTLYTLLTSWPYHASVLVWAEGAEFTGWSWAELCRRYNKAGRAPIMIREADPAP